MTFLLKRCKSLLIYTFSFIGFLAVGGVSAQDLNDIIITEIMADPTPAKGLPEKEYLELYNRSDKSIRLYQFVLYYNSTSAIFPDISIQPNEYLIVTHRNNTAAFLPYGQVAGLNNFSLNNTGSTLIIKNPNNRTLFSVTYTDKWYTQNKTQGFALEMIDTSYPCIEDGNWASSEAMLQGSPGKINSISTSQPDLTPPTLLRYELEDKSTIKLVFSEKLDSLSATNLSAYIFDNSLKIQKIAIESPKNQYIYLGLSTPLQEKPVYTLTVKNIADCSGNVLKETQLLIANFTSADSGEVVINEVLFNPRSQGEDFVEIYNRSDKFISLKNWALANVGTTGAIANIKDISASHFILKPKQFLVVSKSATTIKNQYFKAFTENILEMPALPAFPATKGSVILLNENQQVFDRFDYSEGFHHPLIEDRAGVSLEKADYNVSSDIPSNWHSAASSEGYATPGYANSQGILSSQKKAFTIEPEIFTPDDDGMSDITQLIFELDSPGYVANIYIFDINGRMLNQLAKNQLLGINDRITWDGRSASNEIVPVGYYIILAELFNPNGDKQEFKSKVVVGSKY